MLYVFFTLSFAALRAYILIYKESMKPLAISRQPFGGNYSDPYLPLREG